MTAHDPHLFVFDLDGTLVDSLADIAESVNEALLLLGLPTWELDEYRHLVGEGFPLLCQRATASSRPDLAPRLAELASARYRTRLLRHTRPYPGVPELLSGLRARRCPLAVLSNKAHDLTHCIVEALWPGGPFDFVQGYVREEHRKPHPHHLLDIAGRLGFVPQRTWLIGDTPTDVETARRAGAISVAVTWGFRPRASLVAAQPTHVIDAPHELLALCG